MKVEAADIVKCRSLAWLRQQINETGRLVLPPNTIKAKIAIAEAMGPIVLADSFSTEKYFIPEVEDPYHQRLTGEAQKEAEKSKCWAGRVGCVVATDEGEIIDRNFNRPVVPGQECDTLPVDINLIRKMVLEGEMLNFCQTDHDVGGVVGDAGRVGRALGNLNWYLSLEPCEWCAGNLIRVGAKNVYFTTGVIDRERYYSREGLLRLVKAGVPTFYVRMPEEKQNVA
jgi:deoxycytidylate deaminase